VEREEDLSCKVECPIAQCGPYYSLQEHSEEDPDFLLKLCNIFPEPPYVPTFVRLEEEQRYKRMVSELPFAPLENILEAIIYPIEKQVGNLAEIAEAVLTLIACDTEKCHNDVDVQESTSCFQQEEEDEAASLMDCKQSPAKQASVKDEECCSVI